MECYRGNVFQIYLVQLLFTIHRFYYSLLLGGISCVIVCDMLIGNTEFVE